MKRNTIIIIALLLSVIPILNKPALAWNAQETHRLLAGYAADNSVLSISKGDYLKTLGFDNGLVENLKWGQETKTVREWIADGAEFEDNSDFLFLVLYGQGRYSNHFHNPLKSWESAGLDDWLLFYHLTGESSLLWAQDREKQTQFTEGDWTWQRTREAYYSALISEQKSKIDEYLAQTLRGLGHQMHLIQDCAVPYHVRNDAHIEEIRRWKRRNVAGTSLFEKWARDNSIKYIEPFASNPVLPAVQFDISHSGLVPISQLIDTDQYDGTNPTTDLTQGLAEYTNANFFSEDTVFAAERFSEGDRHYFPYPKASITDLQNYINKLPETVIAEDGVSDSNIYIAKTGDGESIDHFVTATYLTHDIYLYESDWQLFERTFYLDEKCHEDYTEKLIPRAVGYSAALLDYFFRGRIEVLSLEPFTVNDGLGLRLRIKNITPTQEPMIKGDEQPFSLTWRYTPEDANPDGSEDKFITSNYTVCREGNCDEIQYEDEVVLDFYFYWDQAREIYESFESQINCMLVFKGTLGAEESAVIGKNINPGIGQLESASLPLFAENASYAVRMKIKNVTPTREALIKGDGDPFNLVCGYTPEGANPDGSEDIYLTSGENYTCIEGDCDNIQYGDEVTIDFNLSMDEEHRIGTQIYESAEDSVKCLLTFNGKIGENDKTVVVGKYFTLGQNQIKFNEEWDNGLTGNYAWDHTQPDDIQNSDLSTLSNKVEATATSNNSLIKSNVRYAGNHQVEFNINETSVGLNDVITPHTYIQFKIDDLSITGTTKPHWQAMVLRFNEGRYLQLSQNGQSTFMNDTTATYYFTLGTNMVVNIFESFQDKGISIPDPFYIQSINFIQEIFPPELSEVRQHMEVDYIRLIEEK